jgi:hypothetical protein
MNEFEPFVNRKHIKILYSFFVFFNFITKKENSNTMVSCVVYVPMGCCVYYSIMCACRKRKDAPKPKKKTKNCVRTHLNGWCFATYSGRRHNTPRSLATPERLPRRWVAVSSTTPMRRATIVVAGRWCWR